MKKIFFLLFSLSFLLGEAQKVGVDKNGKVIRSSGSTWKTSKGTTPTDPGTPTDPPPSSGDFGTIPAEPTALKTLYYDPAGNNSRTEAEAQNISTPWKDFGAIQNITIAAGTHLQLNGGVYGPSMTAYQSMPMALYAASDRGWVGTKENPIVIKAAPGQTPILSTLATATNPTARFGYPNVWAYPINSIDELGSVKIDGHYRDVTRFPERSAANGGFLMGRSQTGGGQWQTATITGITIPTENIVGADIVTRNSDYLYFSHPITGQTSNSISFTNMSYAPIENGFGTYYQNHVSFLNENYDWAVKSNEGGTDTLFVYFSDNNPANHTVQYATSNLAVWALNARHVQFRGITFEGSSSDLVRLQNAYGIQFYNCTFIGAGQRAIFQINGGDSTIVYGSTARHCKVGAFDLGTEPRVRIENNTVDSIGLFMVRPNWNIEYQGGVLTRIFADGFAGFSAIGGGGDNSRVNGNRITNVGYCGIVFNGANTIVDGNYINGAVIRAKDLGGIYTYQKRSPTLYFTAAQTRYVRNNTVLNIQGNAWGTGDQNYFPVHGIYFDDDADRISVTNNTVANVAKAGIYLHHAQYVASSGNRIFNCSYGYHTRYGDNDSDKLPVGNTFTADTIVAYSPGQGREDFTVVQQGIFSSVTPAQTATISNVIWMPYDGQQDRVLIFNATGAQAAVPYSGGPYTNLFTGQQIPASPVTLPAYSARIGYTVILP